MTKIIYKEMLLSRAERDKLYKIITHKKESEVIRLTLIAERRGYIIHGKRDTIPENLRVDDGRELFIQVMRKQINKHKHMSIQLPAESDDPRCIEYYYRFGESDETVKRMRAQWIYQNVPRRRTFRTKWF